MISSLVLAVLLAVSPEDDLKSKDAFRRAQALFTQARFLDAIKTFEESGRLNPRPAVKFNLARCYEELNESGRALYFYQEYLKAAPNASDKALVEGKIAAYTKKLQSKKLQLLVVRSMPPEALVYIDGQRSGNELVVLEVTLGEHDVAVNATGFEPQKRHVTAGPDDNALVEITLQKMAPPPTPDSAPPMVVIEKEKPKDAPIAEKKKEDNGFNMDPPAVTTVKEKSFLEKHTASLVIAGVGVVAAGVGAGLGATVADGQSQLNTEFHNRVEVDAIKTRMTDMATGANISYGVAGAALVSAIVVFIIENREPAK